MRLLLKANSNRSISFIKTRHGMMHPVAKYPERFLKSVYKTIKNDVLRFDMMKASIIGMFRGSIWGSLGFLFYFYLVANVVDDLRRDHWKPGHHTEIEIYTLVFYILIGTFFGKKE